MGLGSGIQGSKRHRIPEPDPQHCVSELDLEWKVDKTTERKEPDFSQKNL
jgi:hypothetical protein